MKLRNDIGSELESSGSCYSAPAACCGIRQEGGYKGISSSVMKTGIHAIKHGTSSRTASLLVRKPQGTPSCLLGGRRARGARKQHGDLTAAAVQGTVGAVILWLQGCPVGACRALSGPHFTLLAGRLLSLHQETTCLLLSMEKQGGDVHTHFLQQHWQGQALLVAFRVHSDTGPKCCTEGRFRSFTPLTGSLHLYLPPSTACLPYSPSSPAVGEALTQRPVSSSPMGLYVSPHVAIVSAIPAANVAFDLQ